MKKTISVALLFFLSFPVLACLNLYVVNEQGREGIYDGHPVYRIHFYPKYALEDLRRTEEYIKKAGPDQHRYISDYSTYLMRLGRNKEALAILRKLVLSHPREYQILSNVATAFELNGMPDSALVYMRRSMAINAGSHFNSEWFHVRFLEAAIEMRDKGVPVGDIRVLKIEDSTNKQIARQLAIQLGERVPLSSAPNPLLAKAIEESADYYKKNVSIDWAVKLYAMAIGYATDEKMIARIRSKIDASRARVLELHNKNPKAARRDEVRTELVKKTWKEYINKDIVKWQSHKSHYEAKLEILDLD